MKNTQIGKKTRSLTIIRPKKKYKNHRLVTPKNSKKFHHRRYLRPEKK